MKIYVVRHGETDWNAEGRIQGKTDVELNKNGIGQAEKLKEIIKDYDIDLIISSTMKRARKTAEIINETLKCDIIYDASLVERGYGIFEGKIREEITDEVLNSHALYNYNVNKNYGEVETIHDLCSRVWKLLDKIKKDYKDKNILLVTHGGTIQIINAYFVGINKDGVIRDLRINNCEVRMYEI